MIIPVHMLAFMDDKNTIREVELDDKEVESAGVVESVLELVFKMGQNDFQKLPMPSVSVGDIIEYQGNYWMVMPAGFEQLGKEEYDNLKPPTTQYVYQKEIKKSITKPE